MGAAFNMTQYPGELDKDQVQQQFQVDQDVDRKENGSNYSGGFGMADGLTFSTETPHSIHDARNWLSDNAEKWGPAIAVLAYHGPDRLWVIGAWCAE